MKNRSPLVNDFEKMEVTAVKIIKYFDNRLAKLRLDNDSYDSHESTRGRIAEIKDFQKAILPNEPTETRSNTNSM